MTRSSGRKNNSPDILWTFCHIQNPSCQWCQAGGSAAPRIASCRDGFLARPRATHTGTGIPERLCRRLHAHFASFRTLSGPLSSSARCVPPLLRTVRRHGARGGRPRFPLPQNSPFIYIFLFFFAFSPQARGDMGLASVCPPYCRDAHHGTIRRSGPTPDGSIFFTISPMPGDERSDFL